MISMGNRESALSCLSIAPPIEIIANSLQIPNIELTFTKYSKQAIFNILQ